MIWVRFPAGVHHDLGEEKPLGEVLPLRNRTALCDLFACSHFVFSPFSLSVSANSLLLLQERYGATVRASSASAGSPAVTRVGAPFFFSSQRKRSLISYSPSELIFPTIILALICLFATFAHRSMVERKSRKGCCRIFGCLYEDLPALTFGLLFSKGCFFETCL